MITYAESYMPYINKFYWPACSGRLAPRGGEGKLLTQSYFKGGRVNMLGVLTVVLKTSITVVASTVHHVLSRSY